MSQGNTYELFINAVAGVKVPPSERVMALSAATLTMIVTLILSIGRTLIDVKDTDFGRKNGFAQIQAWLTAGGCPASIVENVTKVAVFAEARGKNLRNVHQPGVSQYEGHNALLLVQMIEKDTGVSAALKDLSASIEREMKAKYPIENVRNQKPTEPGTHNNFLSALLIGVSGKAMIESGKANMVVPCVKKVADSMPYLKEQTTISGEEAQWMAMAFGLGSVRASVQLEATAEMVKFMKYDAGKVRAMVYPATMSYDAAKDCGVCTEICEYNNWRLETIDPITASDLADEYYMMKKDPEQRYLIKRCFARCWKGGKKEGCVDELRDVLSGGRVVE